jgi:putative ABC transport system permease protein
MGVTLRHLNRKDTFREYAETWAKGLKENIRFAGNAIVGHKLRAALTILGIVIGVATVISMVSIVTGFNNNIVRNFEAFGATMVQFQKFDPNFGPTDQSERAEQRLRKELTYEDAVALKRLCPSMKAVSPERYWFSGQDGVSVPDVKYGSKAATPDTIVGVNEDYPVGNNHFIAEGRFINDSDLRHFADVTVVGTSIVEALFPKVDPIGKKVLILGHSYEIVGVMEKQGSSLFESTDTHVYLPITTFDQRYGWIKREHGVNIATVPKRPELVSQITEEGVAILRARRHVPFNKPNDFGIRTSDKLIGSFRAVTGGVTLAMIFISSIALIVGGVGVMNIMLVSVTERTREIGIRKAIGAVRRDIVTQFLTEAMTLTGIGGLLGIALGVTVAVITKKLSPLPAETPLWSIAVGFIVSVSIGLFFGIYPAWKAACLDPIEALRYE